MAFQLMATNMLRGWLESVEAFERASKSNVLLIGGSSEILRQPGNKPGGVQIPSRQHFSPEGLLICVLLPAGRMRAQAVAAAVEQVQWLTARQIPEFFTDGADSRPR